MRARPTTSTGIVREKERQTESDAFRDLSDQKLAVLAGVARGKSNAEIGVDLHLSEKTVRNYHSTVMEKLHLSNRVELAVYIDISATVCSATERLAHIGQHATNVLKLHNRGIVTERADRIWPQPAVRQRAATLFPGKRSRWHAQLDAYQRMPVDDLLSAHDVRLSLDLRHLISRNGIRAACAHCGEEIINEREVIVDGQALCRS